MTAAHEILPTRPPRVKARAHSRFVRTLRWVLPLAMVAVVGLLAGLVGAHAIKRQSGGMTDTTQIRMVNPHFYGRDNQGRAYTLGARQASRDEQDFQKVLLQYPSVTMDVEGAHPSTMTADSGVYHEKTRILILTGHVRADDAKTSSFASDQAIVNTKTGTVTGSSALASSTTAGQISGDRYEVHDKGDRVIVRGGVHGRLNQQ